MVDKARPRKGVSLSTQILFGLLLGVLVGFFFGEKASFLGLVGKGYIGLIQMSILPYMVVSLMLGIGSLNYEKAIRLAITGGVILLASWVIAFAVVFIIPLAFPSIEAGTFFSTSLVEVREVDFIDLYIPVNPFSSLARTVVPAAAVFSVVFGIALIGVDSKKTLLDLLSAISKTLTRIAMMVVKLTPIGVFAIAANAAGTMTIEEFGRLQSYIIPFIVATILLTFWVLPGLAAVLTPFRYREILKSARAALVTGFVTGNLFITLPMLVESARELFEERGLHDEDTDSYVEVLVPTSFNFPNIGKLLTLLFVLFAGWYTGKDIAFADYPGFAILGLFTLFGGVDLALPFLLDQMKIPADMYQLYVVTGVVNSWFATLLAVMNLYSFTLVAACAAAGGITFQWKHIARFVVLTGGIFLVVLLGVKILLSVLVSQQDLQRQTLMHSHIESGLLDANQLSKALPVDHRKSHLNTIFKRGKLLVGYNPDNLPFSYYNDDDKLVGFDVELMYEMARDLGVEVEFIPWTYQAGTGVFELDRFDIAIGGLIVTPERLALINFSIPYINMTNAVVVEDYKRYEFTSWQDINKDAQVRLGVVGESRAQAIQRVLPDAHIEELNSFSTFFTDYPQTVDALVISAEAGSAWTVLYPSFSVVVPTPQMKRHAALALPMDESNFADFVDDWLLEKKTSGFIDRLYDKWILGKIDEEDAPRWSIGRNVLGLWE